MAYWNLSASPFQAAPRTWPPLNPGQVHIWRSSLDLTAAEIAELSSLLSPAESQRAERFAFEPLRTRYIAAHGILRHILSAYTKIPAASLCFDIGPYGKPQLAPCVMEFNLSHSQDYALFAVSYDPIGVDIELIRADFECDALAKRFFAPQEHLQLAHLAEPATGFFNAWARKEAFLKAIGEGMYFPLNQVTVSLLPGETAEILQIEHPNYAQRLWTMIDLTLPTPWVGAAVVQGCVTAVDCWDYRLV